MTPALAIQLVLQYGPQILTEVEALFTKSIVTAAEVNSIFDGLKPYSAFGIAPPAPPAPSPTVKTG